MTEYIVKLIKSREIKEKEEIYDGNLIATLEFANDESGFGWYDVILNESIRLNMYTGQKVTIRTKEFFSNRTRDGEKLYVSSDYELNQEQKSIADYEKEIEEIFNKHIAPNKRALYTKHQEENDLAFPFVIIPKKDRVREITDIFIQTQNIKIYHELDKIDTTLIGFEYDNRVESDNFFRRLISMEYNLQEISHELGEALRNPDYKISLTQEIAKRWVGKAD